MMKTTRLGKLPPRYTFILNPYADARFTRCPDCNQRMKQRKLPLFIHIDPMNGVVLNKTCRYCPDCDLLIAHQDEIEGLLAAMFAEHNRSVIGNDYLVLGTVERAAWRDGMKQPLTIPEMVEHLHDFKEVHTVRVQPGGWYPADMDPSELPIQEPVPLSTPWRKRTQPLDPRPDTLIKAAGSRRPKPKRRRRRRK